MPYLMSRTPNGTVDESVVPPRAARASHVSVTLAKDTRAILDDGALWAAVGDYQAAQQALIATTMGLPPPATTGTTDAPITLFAIPARSRPQDDGERKRARIAIVHRPRRMFVQRRGDRPSWSLFGERFSFNRPPSPIRQHVLAALQESMASSRGGRATGQPR
jgi:hypothetical protein